MLNQCWTILNPSESILLFLAFPCHSRFTSPGCMVASAIATIASSSRPWTSPRSSLRRRVNDLGQGWMGIWKWYSASRSCHRSQGRDHEKHDIILYIYIMYIMYNMYIYIIFILSSMYYIHSYTEVSIGRPQKVML